MSNNSSSPRSLQAEKGYRGARLGEPYIYRWVDQEPTKQTWADLGRHRGCLGMFIGMVAILSVCTWVAGQKGFILGFLFLSGISFISGRIFQASGRTDDEPIPMPVWREAYIEYAEGDFYFVLEEDGKARIWQPWELVRQFEKVNYWSMFGDAGACPYKTGWHAIAMTPLVGRPWMIGSTIEGESYVRERFTELDARFSADTRARFMRALEARKSAASRQTTPTNAPEFSNGSPLSPKDKGVPEIL